MVPVGPLAKLFFDAKVWYPPSNNSHCNGAFWMANFRRVIFKILFSVIWTPGTCLSILAYFKVTMFAGYSMTILWNGILRHYYTPAASARRGQRAFGLSECAHVRPSEDQVQIFVQCRISRPINGSKLIFHTRMYLIYKSHDPMTDISRSTDFRLLPDYQG